MAIADIGGWARSQIGGFPGQRPKRKSGQRWRYQRDWVEPAFRNRKSNRFESQTSRRTDAQLPEYLRLGMALTTVWLIHFGEHLVRTGRDLELETRRRQTTVAFAGARTPCSATVPPWSCLTADMDDPSPRKPNVGKIKDNYFLGVLDRVGEP